MELRHALGRAGRTGRRWSPGLAALLAVTLTGVVVPPGVAWAAEPGSEDLIWSPAQTPLGADTPSVAGRQPRPDRTGARAGGAAHLSDRANDLPLTVYTCYDSSWRGGVYDGYDDHVWRFAG
ncbi:hypothetical protein ACFXAF_18440 [Kitasatospora sp. NPDC059463]|uniref:hypothetical protein n=1 Tax=Kitasatospora sp. NPDC059463 TaxID=3346842 RepID=UPI0036D1C375